MNQIIKGLPIKYIIILLIINFSISCSRINQESRDYYRQKNMRHGIIPLSSSVSKKLDEASVGRGKILYEHHCISCHGVKGQGDGDIASQQDHRPADLQKLVREVKDFKFFMSISQWQGDMPGWKDSFNDSDREDLVAYIKTFK